MEETLSEAGCKEGTPWPDEERKGKCPQKGWGEPDKAAVLLGSFAGAVAAITAGIFLLF